MCNFLKVVLLAVLSLAITGTTLKAQTLITIPKGSSSKQISKILVQNKIIDSPLNYRLYLKAYRLETTKNENVERG